MSNIPMEKPYQSSQPYQYDPENDLTDDEQAVLDGLRAGKTRWQLVSELNKHYHTILYLIRKLQGYGIAVPQPVGRYEAKKSMLLKRLEEGASDTDIVIELEVKRATLASWKRRLRDEGLLPKAMMGRPVRKDVDK